MKLKIKEKNKFKHIRGNILDIPTGELETPLTNGHEVVKFLMKHANKERYQFKARGRGSRKKYGNSYDLPVEHAEKIAVYHQTKERISFKEHQEKRRSKSAWEISRLLSDVKKIIQQHNQLFDNDLEVNLEVNDESI